MFPPLKPPNLRRGFDPPPGKPIRTELNQMQHTIILTRENDACAILELGAPTNSPTEALELLRTTLTKWHDETKEGAAAWKESSEDFNIGDFAIGNFACGYMSADSLQPFFAASGIELECNTGAFNPGGWHYDSHLITPEKATT